jgi:hypothetical protein
VLQPLDARSQRRTIPTDGQRVKNSVVSFGGGMTLNRTWEEALAGPALLGKGIVHAARTHRFARSLDAMPLRGRTNSPMTTVVPTLGG